MSDIKKFAIKLVSIALVLVIVGFLTFKFLLPQYYLPIMPWALAFFLVVTILVHAYQLKMAKTNVAKFTRVSMIMTFVKLLIYSIFIVIFLAISKQNAIPFVVVVMILYIAFTITEVTDLMKVVRASKKQ